MNRENASGDLASGSAASYLIARWDSARQERMPHRFYTRRVTPTIMENSPRSNAAGDMRGAGGLSFE